MVLSSFLHEAGTWSLEFYRRLGRLTTPLRQKKSGENYVREEYGCRNSVQKRALQMLSKNGLANPIQNTTLQSLSENGFAISIQKKELNVPKLEKLRS